MKNIKVWKKVKKNTHKNITQCLKDLDKKGFVLSPWIKNIYKNKKNKIIFTNKDFNLYRVKLTDLGFKKPTKLKDVYKVIKKKNFDLVSPDLALRARFLYLNQKKGEWLRFATPLNSMFDTDGIPHLPKLGRALGKYFIETYWSYPNAIFHPHNEFVVTRKLSDQ